MPYLTAGCQPGHRHGVPVTIGSGAPGWFPPHDVIVGNLFLRNTHLWPKRAYDNASRHLLFHAMMSSLAGIDTVRGIAYQQAQAVVAAVDLLNTDHMGAIRVEGADDVVDIELFNHGGLVVHSIQAKTRTTGRPWAPGELLKILRAWGELKNLGSSTFEFLTDGGVGPEGTRLDRALIAASEGHLDELAGFVGSSAESPLCQTLARARIRVDAATVEELLQRAEREVVTMLPGAGLDLIAEARTKIDALFRHLFDKGSIRDPAARMVRRTEIASILGVPANQLPAHRWPGSTRAAFLTEISARGTAVSVRGLFKNLPAIVPKLVEYGVSKRAVDVDVSALLATPSLVFGPTGTGKTTVTAQLQYLAGKRGVVVLRANAEAYLPGRLAALAADALGHVLGLRFPLSTGKQLLCDPDVIMVVDGVSEIPESLQSDLQQEFAPMAMSSQSAGIVLVGRDLAATLAVLPQTCEPVCHLVAPIGESERWEIAGNLNGVTGEHEEVDESTLRMRVREAESLLGEASSNPLLFSMTVYLLLTGSAVRNSTDLYDQVVELLALRTGTSEIEFTVRCLGTVYAQLLDHGRRYAKRTEWKSLVHRAAAAISGKSANVMEPGETVLRAALRSGLVAPEGMWQRMTPIHDSFADYFAARAHFAGVPFPENFSRGDEQRLLFYAEFTPLSASLLAQIARDLPFFLVRLSHLEGDNWGNNGPNEVEKIMSLLVPPGIRSGVELARIDDGRIGARISGGPSGWIPQEEFMGTSETVARIVARPSIASVVVALWRTLLRQQLGISTSQLGYPRPNSVSEARSLLEKQIVESATRTKELISRIGPPAIQNALSDQIGSLSIRAFVYNESGIDVQELGFFSVDSDKTIVTVVSDTDAIRQMQQGRLSRSSVQHTLAKAPIEVAIDRLRGAINAVVGSSWI